MLGGLTTKQKTKSLTLCKRSHTLAGGWGELVVQRPFKAKENSTCPGVRNTMCNILLRGDWDLFLGRLEWARTEVGGSTKEY